MATHAWRAAPKVTTSAEADVGPTQFTPPRILSSSARGPRSSSAPPATCTLSVGISACSARSEELFCNHRLTIMATTVSQASTPLQQRLQRFLKEDVTTFALCSTLGSGLFAAREYQKVAATTPTHQRLQRALRKTLPIVPAIVLSSAVGIIGMKITLGAVQDARRDYSRTSVLIAVPLFVALIHAPAGPRAMAKSAVGYGVFILAADAAASEYHHYNAMKMEMEMVEQEQSDFNRHHPSLHFGSETHGWSHNFAPSPPLAVFNPAPVRADK